MTHGVTRSLAPGTGSEAVALLLKAAAFAADKHREQRRKGVDASPYINHPLEVAAMLANIGAVTDVATLVAAILHDTIEDTSTTGQELEALFGRQVRMLVEEVTDDKRLGKAERKRLQVDHAPTLSAAAKVIKLGDKISNVAEVTRNPPAGWPMSRRLEYLEWAERVVAGCRGVNDGLEREFDTVLARGREALAREGSSGQDAYRGVSSRRARHSRRLPRCRRRRRRPAATSASRGTSRHW